MKREYSKFLKFSQKRIEDYSLFNKKSRLDKMTLIFTQSIKKIHTISSGLIDDKIILLIKLDFELDNENKNYRYIPDNIILSNKEYIEIIDRISRYINYYNKLAIGEIKL